MTCSVNHATLATKFCPVCGGSASQSAPAAPAWQNPTTPQFQQPQFQQPQFQQPQFQQQPTNQNYSQTQFPFPVASRGKRLGGILLDALFMTITLYIGWAIWTLIIMKDGQTPGKQVLKMRTYGSRTHRPATWGHMAIRTILIPLAFAAVYLPSWIENINYVYYSYDPFYFMQSGWYGFGTFLTLVIFIIELVLFFVSPINQRLTDRWAKTVILDETPRWAQQY
jgi:uncharacterized RDD family membrane protein YckC